MAWCIPGRGKTKSRRSMYLLVDGRATTKHRGFVVDVTIPSETVARVIGGTFVALPKVSCQTHTLVNIFC